MDSNQVWCHTSYGMDIDIIATQWLAAKNAIGRCKQSVEMLKC